MVLLHLLFWATLGLLFYTYLGYPLLLHLLARRRPRPVIDSDAPLPTVSLVIAAHNEARHIAVKARNCLELDYPANRLEVVLVDDGSEDDTADVFQAAWQEALDARDGETPDLRVVSLDTRSGKATALNRGVAEASGDIVVFSDADSLISAHSLPLLVRPFSNPIVGCVAGRYFPSGVGACHAGGVGFYWRYENYLRRKESDVGGLLGASGALYALRRERYVALRDDLINDDFILPMAVAAQGYRTLYEPSATAIEDDSHNEEHEFARRIRIMTGNCQHLWHFRGLILSLVGLGDRDAPGGRRLGFQLLCHKLLRVLSPLCLMIVLLLSMVLSGSPPFIGRWSLYVVLFAIQVALYGLAAVGYLLKSADCRTFAARSWARAFTLPYYFLLLNMSAAAGIYYFLFQNSEVPWATRGGLAADSEQNTTP